MTLEEKYEELCNTPSDIFKHLPTLYKYSTQCDSVVEFGVRNIVSTYALLMGKPKKMVSYDINEPNWRPVQEMVKEHTDFTFIKGNTLEIEIEDTDLLFIDTLHNYDQIKKELDLHGNKAHKFLIFHDTTTYEWRGESYDGKQYKGIWPAIEEFMTKYPHWKLHERSILNNGLTVLKSSI